MGSGWERGPIYRGSLSVRGLRPFADPRLLAGLGGAGALPAVAPGRAGAGWVLSAAAGVPAEARPRSLRFPPAKQVPALYGTVCNSLVYLKGTGKGVTQPMCTGWITCFFSYCNDFNSLADRFAVPFGKEV